MSCAVCYDAGYYVPTDCGHVVCGDCLNEWFRVCSQQGRNHVCPVCRAVLHHIQIPVTIGGRFSGMVNEWLSRWWLWWNTMPCPECKVPVWKHDGCDALQCSRCQHHFFWAPPSSYVDTGFDHCAMILLALCCCFVVFYLLHSGLIWKACLMIVIAVDIIGLAALLINLCILVVLRLFKCNRRIQRRLHSLLSYTFLFVPFIPDSVFAIHPPHLFPQRRRSSRNSFHRSKRK